MSLALFGVAAALIAAIAAMLAAILPLTRFAALERAIQELRLATEQVRAGQRSETETLRGVIDAGQSALRRELTGPLDALHERLGRNHAALISDLGTAQERNHVLLETKLRELREGNEQKLTEIQRSVNEQLHQAVEQQMTASFTRVADQFAQVQKAMGDVQAVTAQIGDIKRLFANVKTRGGWGETQLRALLDDVLPAGAYETNKRLTETSAEAVEFAVIMPAHGADKVYLPIDAKFPVEDYERLLNAAEAGDIEAERAARAALARRVREEAKKIQAKYIVPPVTMEFAVMYLATDGLYTEIARVPGLIDEIGRQNRVLVLGPSLAPALLRTIHLGHLTLALEQKADEVRTLLGAAREEMGKMDEVLSKLAKQAGSFSNTIESARRRTRAIGRKLRGVEAVAPQEAERLLGLDGDEFDADVDAADAPP